MLELSLKRRKGISLIETSIYLAIMGILLVVALASGKKIFDRVKLARSKNAVENAVIALDAYYKKNGRLPCPSTPTTNIDTAVDVPENCTQTTSGANKNTFDLYNNNIASFKDNVYNNGSSLVSASSPQASPINAAGGAVFSLGGIPTSTLGLSKSAGLDGYGRQLSYVVVTKFTTATPPVYYRCPYGLWSTTYCTWTGITPSTYDLRASDGTYKRQGYVYADQVIPHDSSNNPIVYFLNIIANNATITANQTNCTNNNTGAAVLYPNQNFASCSTPTRIAEGVIFIVISHGPNGFGAYNSDGTRIVVSNSSIPAVSSLFNDDRYFYNDYINLAARDTSYFARSFVVSTNFDDTQGSNTSDDIVMYKKLTDYYDFFATNNKIGCKSATFNFTAITTNDISSTFPDSPSSILPVSPSNTPTCPSGFLKVSSSSAKCTNGEWTNVIPIVCAKTGNESSYYMQ